MNELRFTTKKGIYALYDTVAYSYMPVVEFPNDESAVRGVYEAHKLGKVSFPDDIKLVRLGWLENETLVSDLKNLGFLNELADKIVDRVYNNEKI